MAIQLGVDVISEARDGHRVGSSPVVVVTACAGLGRTTGSGSVRSPQLAASFEQIGRTLSSWPQLASGVALGGALTGEAARRILLGLPCQSGRYYTDLETQLEPWRNTAVQARR